MINTLLKHPGKTLLIILLLTLPCLCFISDIKIDQSADGMINQEDPDTIYYEKVKELFGGDMLITIILKSDHLFQEAVLQAIEDLTYSAENLEHVSRVVSLSTVYKIKSVDGFLETDQVMASVPYDEEGMASVRDYVLEDELLLKEVISPDGRTAAINVFIEPQPNDPDFLSEITTAVDSHIANIKQQLGNEVEIYAIGSPYLQTETTRLIKQDQLTLVPLSFLVILIVLFAFFRSFLACLIPIITGFISVVATMAFIAICGFSINPVSGTIPILLLIIGSTEDIHLLADYIRELRTKAEKDEAVRSMMRRSLTAISLTSITTFIGFLTITTNSIPMLREFGIATAFGIAANFIATVVVVPSLLLLAKAPKQKFKKKNNESAQGLEHKVADFTLKFRKPILFSCGLIIALCVIGCFKVKVNSDFLGYFHEASPIRQNFEDIEHSMAGGYSFYVVAEAPEDGEIKDPRFLKDIAKLEDFLSERFNKVLGFGGLIRRINKEINDGDPSKYAIPDSTNLVSQFTLMVDQDTLSRFVDYDYRHACIIVRSGDGSSEFLREMQEATMTFVEENISRDLSIHFAGQIISVSKGADALSYGIVINITLMLITIFIVISLLFFSPRAGLLALIPNLFPVLAIFGTMGWFQMPLSIATFSVAAIAIGIAVDDTIHFMARYNEEMKRQLNHKEAMRCSVIHEFKPVLSTSLALALGFSILIFSNFGTVSEFGLLSAIAMIFAFIGDIFFTPCLLLNVPFISSWDYFKLKIDVESVKKSALLQGLTVSEIKKLALLGLLKEFEKGEAIIAQGDDNRDLYLILKGSTEVSVNDQDKQGSQERKISTAHAGEVIGEVAFITHERRTATVRATEYTEILVINEATLKRVTERYTKISAKIYQNMSKILSKRLVASTLTNQQ